MKKLTTKKIAAFALFVIPAVLLLVLSTPKPTIISAQNQVPSSSQIQKKVGEEQKNTQEKIQAQPYGEPELDRTNENYRVQIQEQTQEKMERSNQTKTNAQEKVQEKTQAALENRSQAQKQVLERVAQAHKQRITRRFDFYYQRLTTIVDKIQKRLDQIAKERGEVVQAQENLNEAILLLEQAKERADQAIADLDQTIDNSETIQNPTALRNMASNIKSEVQQAREEFKSARKVMIEAVQAAKQANQ